MKKNKENTLKMEGEKTIFSFENKQYLYESNNLFTDYYIMIYKE